MKKNKNWQDVLNRLDELKKKTIVFVYL